MIFLRGEEGDDNIFGDLGDDSLAGEAGNDQLAGGRGADILSGGLGDDLISGFSIQGGAAAGMGAPDGADQLFGGAGDDRLILGRGDSATGGAGADTFVGSAADFNGDTIADFSTADRITVTGVDLSPIEPVTLTRSQWAAETLEAYRPLFTRLAESLAAPASVDDAADPMTQMMSGLSRLMGPAMIGMAVGSMVGNLAQHCFGTHDLPIPRTDRQVSLIGTTIDAFASEWDVPVDEMRLWVLAHEYAGWAVLAEPTLRVPLTELVSAHVGGFRPDPEAVAEKLAGLDMTSGDAFAGIQEAFSDPEVLLGAVRSDEQRSLEPRLDAAVAAVLGLTDWIVDAVAVRVVGGGALRIAEAVRRRRVEAAPSDVFVHRLLGIRVDEGCVRRGKQFVQGVVDRAGESVIATMISAPEACPTPAEISAS